MKGSENNRRKAEATSRSASSGRPAGTDDSARTAGTRELTDRQRARRRRRRRKKLLGMAILTAGVLLLLLVVALVVLHITGTVAKNNGSQLSFLAVKDIRVEGDTRYSAEEVIQASGIYVGESLLVVNKVQAHDAILKQFPYLERVEVSNVSFSTIRIQVEETAVLGAVQTPDGFAMLGRNNHRLENLSEDRLPAGTVRIYGASLQGAQIGEDLLDERCLRIVRTLLTAVEQNGVESLTAIDLTEKTNIQAVWREQILLVLGNESNLAEEIRAFQALLPTLLKNNGEQAIGRLDMTSYSDDDSENNRAIFSPLDSLPQPAGTTASGDSPTDNAADGDASAGQAAAGQSAG